MSSSKVAVSQLITVAPQRWLVQRALLPAFEPAVPDLSTDIVLTPHVLLASQTVRMYAVTLHGKKTTQGQVHLLAAPLHSSPQSLVATTPWCRLQACQVAGLRLNGSLVCATLLRTNPANGSGGALHVMVGSRGSVSLRMW